MAYKYLIYYRQGETLLNKEFRAITMSFLLGLAF